MDTKVGVYICSGCDIAKAIDVESLAEKTKSETNVPVCKVNEFLCGEKAIAEIKEDIKNEELNRVVIAACSQRVKTNEFNFEDTPEVLVERTNIREHCAWVQKPEDEDTQMMAEDYLRMGVSRAQHAAPPEANIEEISKTIMVVGGGTSGLNSALQAADAGYDVILVEKEEELGGWARKFKKTFPLNPPYRELEDSGYQELVQKVNDHDKIKVYTSTTIKKSKGQPGQLDVTLQNGGAPEDIRVGSIVMATGWKPYDPEKLGYLGYGKCENVVTNVQMEEMAMKDDFKRPSDGKEPESIAFIQCAGSRDKDHLPYCSTVCCRVSLKQAMYLREKYPNAKIFIIYKDIRTPAQFEMFYARVQEDENIFFTKGEVVEVAEDSDKGVLIDVDETLLGEKIQVKADMLVLASGMVPTTRVEGAVGFLDEGGEAFGPPKTADGDKPEEKAEEPEEGEKKAAAGAEKGAKILNLSYRQGTDLPTLKYGFPDSHYICFPYETRRTAIYAAGCVRAPMDSYQAQHDASGAALKAIQAMEALSVGKAVHPRAGDLSFPDFFLQRCTQCKRCTEECPFGSLDEDDKGTPKPNFFRCRRCGICLGSCPERIISFKNYSVPIGSHMIRSIEIPEEIEEKPRVLVFICENDALPSFDIAGLKRLQYSPYIRLIPVRCLGALNTVWIADALSAGFDGILLIGCKPGENYQCHFVRGSQLAEYRMGNVKEKLKQLVLEEERVRIEHLALTDYDKIPGIIEDFMEEIDTVGPNPYKDF
ncbi:MAG: hydrogenase iron-sulfur subunit [candidate division Zixibacteria bacterium]|nr:hydrogenase iron-sulfur subunit [candidate division Zixibacteria bacterium]